MVLSLFSNICVITFMAEFPKVAMWAAFGVGFSIVDLRHEFLFPVLFIFGAKSCFGASSLKFFQSGKL